MAFSATTTTSSFPPIKVHSSQRLSKSQTHDLITQYLEDAKTNPSLHPNAILTEKGPYTTDSATNMGLVLNNISRVAAGLRGERLAVGGLLGGDVTKGKGAPKFGQGGEEDGGGGGREKEGVEEEGQKRGKKRRKTDLSTENDVASIGLDVFDGDDNNSGDREAIKAAKSKGEQSAGHSNVTAASVAVAESGVGAEESMDVEWQDRGEFEREQEVVQGEMGQRDNGGSIPEGEKVPVVRCDRDERKVAKRERKEHKRKQKKEKEEKRLATELANDANLEAAKQIKEDSTAATAEKKKRNKKRKPTHEQVESKEVTEKADGKESKEVEDSQLQAADGKDKKKKRRSGKQAKQISEKVSKRES